MILVCIVALLAGVCAALFFPAVIPYEYLSFSGIFVLYAAGALVDTIRLMINHKLKLKIFISGLICGLIFIFLLIIAGEGLDLDIYPVCLLVLVLWLVKSCCGIFKHYTGRNI